MVCKHRKSDPKVAFSVDTLCYAVIVEDDVDDGIDVIKIDLAISVDVGISGIAVSVKDDVDDVVHIGDVDFKVAVHIACQEALHNLLKIGTPVLVGPISIGRSLKHMMRSARKKV